MFNEFDTKRWECPPFYFFVFFVCCFFKMYFFAFWWLVFANGILDYELEPEELEESFSDEWLEEMHETALETGVSPWEDMLKDPSWVELGSDAELRRLAEYNLYKSRRRQSFLTGEDLTKLFYGVLTTSESSYIYDFESPVLAKRDVISELVNQRKCLFGETLKSLKLPFSKVKRIQEYDYGNSWMLLYERNLLIELFDDDVDDALKIFEEVSEDDSKNYMTWDYLKKIYKTNEDMAIEEIEEIAAQTYNKIAQISKINMWGMYCRSFISFRTFFKYRVGNPKFFHQQGNYVDLPLRTRKSTAQRYLLESRLFLNAAWVKTEKDHELYLQAFRNAFLFRRHGKVVTVDEFELKAKPMFDYDKDIDTFNGLRWLYYNYIWHNRCDRISNLRRKFMKWAYIRSLYQSYAYDDIRLTRHHDVFKYPLLGWVMFLRTTKNNLWTKLRRRDLAYVMKLQFFRRKLLCYELFFWNRNENYFHQRKDVKWKFDINILARVKYSLYKRHLKWLYRKKT